MKNKKRNSSKSNISTEMSSDLSPECQGLNDRCSSGEQQCNSSRKSSKNKK